tara:strand:- start:6177 stop:6542 length:366 start_codon:yes stop_codon:yes gene_type:complete
MFTLRKKFKFESAHKLEHHDGKCAMLHGHSWIGWAEIKSPELQTTGAKAGMVMDYGDIKKAIAPMVEKYLDHHYLNSTLEMDMPTSERVAEWVFNYLESKIMGLVAIEIEETCTSSCRYER